MVNFNIPAQPLTSALTAFARQSGVQLAYPAALAAGKSAPALSGQLSPEDALGRLLNGTGLTYSFTGAKTATINDPTSNNSSATVDGAVALDTIDVSGGSSSVSAAEAPYRTPGSTAYVSSSQIAQFPGTTPGDIFKNTTGVLSGENRNGGAIDVNIRGMQGMGRVPVTIDGSMNATTVYQGYQGIGNRTYIDPDLIGGIVIEKGPSASPGGGIGGLVSIETLGADDIVRPGQTLGVRIKGDVGTNTSESIPGYLTRGGYNFPSGHYGPGVDNRQTGMDRPGLFEPTSKNGSIAIGAKTDTFDFLGAVAKRVSDNYYAGTNGRSAGTTGNLGPTEVCNSVGCQMQNPYYTNSGLTIYRAGEEVLNTSLDSTSYLLKGKLHSVEQSLELGYIGYRSEGGDIRASMLSDSITAPSQQYVSMADTDTLTARYRWNPVDNDLINLKANAWTSWLNMRQQTQATRYTLAQVGRPPLTEAPTYVGSDSRMSGGDITNTSTFNWAIGKVSVNYGGSYIYEDSEPTELTKKLENFKPRDGWRGEASLFSKVSWNPVDWLTFDASVRYLNFRSKDRGTQLTGIPELPDPGDGSKSGDGTVPAAGVTIEPVKGFQLYATYTEGLRLPSLMETSSTFLLIVTPDLAPEHAYNWEFGANILRDGVISSNDKLRVKAAYFDNTIDD
ncbi:MAG: TonB-dependent receptor, partial [Proteobacteria bacterium]|nr:TonB-dependent receptor [Pseudomonadota bacterium]